MTPVLLPRGDHERGLVVRGRDHGPHRVAKSWTRVQVYEGRPANAMGETLGHSERRRLLQAEHVAEVIRKVLEERQLRRSGVAENRRHFQAAQEIEGRLADPCHCVSPLLEIRPSGWIRFLPPAGRDLTHDHGGERERDRPDEPLEDGLCNVVPYASAFGDFVFYEPGQRLAQADRDTYRQKRKEPLLGLVAHPVPPCRRGWAAQPAHLAYPVKARDHDHILRSGAPGFDVSLVYQVPDRDVALGPLGVEVCPLRGAWHPGPPERHRLCDLPIRQVVERAEYPAGVLFDPARTTLPPQGTAFRR